MVRSWFSGVKTQREGMYLLEYQATYPCVTQLMTYGRLCHLLYKRSWKFHHLVAGQLRPGKPVRTAKKKCQKFEANIPRKGISGPQSQFPHSCVCRFCWRKYVDRSWENINRSQTHDCWNWGWGRAIPRKGIYKRNCLCSAVGPVWKRQAVHHVLTTTYVNILQ